MFSIFGLYRAVIRFMGPKAMLTVVAGVSLSVIALALYDRLGTQGPPEFPLTALAIYWALALLYVIGSRCFIRYLFSRTRNGSPPARVASYGCTRATRDRRDGCGCWPHREALADC